MPKTLQVALAEGNLSAAVAVWEVQRSIAAARPQGLPQEGQAALRQAQAEIVGLDAAARGAATQLAAARRAAEAAQEAVAHAERQLGRCQVAAPACHRDRVMTVMFCRHARA